jgi:hypothetical protein
MHEHDDSNSEGNGLGQSADNPKDAAAQKPMQPPPKEKIIREMDGVSSQEQGEDLLEKQNVPYLHAGPTSKKRNAPRGLTNVADPQVTLEKHSTQEPEKGSAQKPERASPQQPPPQKPSPKISPREISSDELSSDESSGESANEEVDSSPESEPKDQILFNFSRGFYTTASFRFRIFGTLTFLNLYNYQDRLTKLNKKIRYELQHSGKIQKKHKRKLATLLREYRMS